MTEGGKCILLCLNHHEKGLSHRPARTNTQNLLTWKRHFIPVESIKVLEWKMAEKKKEGKTILPTCMCFYIYIYIYMWGPLLTWCILYPNPNHHKFMTLNLNPILTSTLKSKSKPLYSRLKLWGPDKISLFPKLSSHCWLKRVFWFQPCCMHRHKHVDIMY